MTEIRDVAASAVLLGRFNPLIFSPDWLHTNGVIGPQEAAEAREHGIEVMAPNVTSIGIGSMKLVVETERFLLNVFDEPLIRAKDFASNCFRLLSHTPVFAVGINLNAVLRLQDESKWHRFGDLLAPKAPWGEFVSDAEGKRTGGLRGLVMERTGAPGDRQGATKCTIQIPEGVTSEVNIQINNHFALGDPASPSDGSTAYKLFMEVWDQAFESSSALIERVRSMADAA